MTARVQRVDVGQLRPPKYLADGRVRVDATISRTGVQVYHDHVGKEIREYRPDSEVFSQASIDSMQLVVVTDDHPPVFITDANRSQYERGTVLESVRRDGDHLVAALLITDKALIEKMKRGKRDISLGYACELEMTPGTAPNGEKYDAVQRLIVGNHAAIVDRGRAGTARARMDGLAIQIFETERTTMTTQITDEDPETAARQRMLLDSRNAHRAPMDGSTVAAPEQVTADQAPAPKYVAPTDATGKRVIFGAETDPARLALMERSRNAHKHPMKDGGR